jgi:hypothetical protein
MWEPRRLTFLWASMASYRDSFPFFLYIGIHIIISLLSSQISRAAVALFDLLRYITYTIWIIHFSLFTPNSYDRCTYIGSVGLLVIYPLVKILNFMLLWRSACLIEQFEQPSGGGGEQTFSPPAGIIISLRNTDIWDVRPYSSRKKTTFRGNISPPSMKPAKGGGKLH